MDIGRRLKIAREAIGYTQAKAAQESGIGKSSISDFEKSKREPKFSQLSKLAEVYRKTIEFFLIDKLPAENLMLWREAPSTDEEIKKTEAEFQQLCEQYRNLEAVMDEMIADGHPCMSFRHQQNALMMREYQIQTAAVKIEALTQR